MNGLILALAGFAISLATWVAYLASIQRNKVPVRPLGSVLLQIVAVGLAIAGLAVWVVREEATPGAAVIAPAVFALMMGGLFLWILTQRRTPVGDLKVKVGDSLLPFAATTASGAAFHSDSFADKRILLKFFRGSW